MRGSRATAGGFTHTPGVRGAQKPLPSAALFPENLFGFIACTSNEAAVLPPLPLNCPNTPQRKVRET